MLVLSDAYHICVLLGCAEEREKDRKQLEDLSTAGATKGLHPNARDADDVDPSDDSDSEGDDSDNEMEALQAELAKIRCDLKVPQRCWKINTPLRPSSPSPPSHTFFLSEIPFIPDDLLCIGDVLVLS